MTVVVVALAQFLNSDESLWNYNGISFRAPTNDRRRSVSAWSDIH